MVLTGVACGDGLVVWLVQEFGGSVEGVATQLLEEGAGVLKQLKKDIRDEVKSMDERRRLEEEAAAKAAKKTKKKKA